MSERPSPVQFARYSYMLAMISGGIIILVFLISWQPIEALKGLVNIVWLVVVTSGVGTFLGFAAQADFKKNPGPDVAMHQAKMGFRFNTLALVAMVLQIGLIIVVQVLSSSVIPIK